MTGLDLTFFDKRSSTREIWAAAAVRERFRTGDLLAQWLEGHGDADASLQAEAMNTSMAIQDVAKPALGSDGRDALRLPTDVRMKVLKDLGVKAARQGSVRFRQRNSHR